MTHARNKTRQSPRGAGQGQRGAGAMEDKMSRCAEMMPQMMTMCCGAPDDDQEEAAPDPTPEA